MLCYTQIHQFLKGIRPSLRDKQGLTGNAERFPSDSLDGNKLNVRDLGQESGLCWSRNRKTRGF